MGLKFLMEGYRRWRHSRGYGVHSPFAYKIVTDVIRPGNYGYYAYDAILKAASRISDSRKCRTAEENGCLVCRLAAVIRTKRLFIFPAKTKVMDAVAQGMNIPLYKAELNSLPSIMLDGDMIVADDNLPPETDFSQLMQKDIAVISFNSGKILSEKLKTAMSNGLLLSGKKTIIAIARKDMAFVEYSMKF